MLGVALSDLTGQIKNPRWAAGQTQGSIFTKVYHKAEVQSMNELDDLTLISCLSQSMFRERMSTTAFRIFSQV